MREVHHLGFRFYVVKDQPGTPPTIVECSGKYHGVPRHEDLSGSRGDRQYKEAHILVHQLGQVSTHVYTSLWKPDNLRVPIDREWPCTCMSPMQPPFRPVTEYVRDPLDPEQVEAPPSPEHRKLGDDENFSEYEEEFPPEEGETYDSAVELSPEAPPKKQARVEEPSTVPEWQLREVEAPAKRPASPSFTRESSAGPPPTQVAPAPDPPAHATAERVRALEERVEMLDHLVTRVWAYALDVERRHREGLQELIAAQDELFIASHRSMTVSAINEGLSRRRGLYEDLGGPVPRTGCRAGTLGRCNWQTPLFGPCVQTPTPERAVAKSPD